MTASVDEAFKNGLIGKRQHKALKKHAEKHTEEHIAKMLTLMRHTTLAKAHKIVGQDMKKQRVAQVKRWLALSKKAPWSCHCPKIF